MPKENYTISAFHGGLNSSSDPRDIRNEDLSIASGVDVSSVGKVSIMNGEEPHFSTGVMSEHTSIFSEVQPGYGLFSYKTDALGTSSQSNNFLRTEQIQYGSSGSNSLGKVVFRLNELLHTDTVINYKLYFYNVAIDSGTATAESINGVYYLPLSGSNTINRGVSIQDLAENLTNSINTHINTAIGTEFSATRVGNQVTVKADTQTSDGNGDLILHATAGDLLNIGYTIDNMVGGLASQHQKTRFTFPEDTVSAITYFITLGGTDRYTLTGNANDKIFHILNRFVHANGSTNTTSHADHPVYSDGTLSTSTSVNSLKLNGASNDAGIDGNSNYYTQLELQPDVTEIIETGTAQAGGSTTITLASGASDTDDNYNNYYIFLTGGTGFGQRNKIDDYTGSSRVATVSTWGTNPDNTTTYEIIRETDVSLLYNYDFGIGSDGWGSANFAFTSGTNPYATYNDSAPGYIQQQVPIESNTLYQLSFSISAFTAQITVRDYDDNVNLIEQITHAIGNHTFWFYHTNGSNYNGLRLEFDGGSSGACRITDIKLQEVLSSIIVTSATKSNFLVDSGIEQTEGYIGNRWLAVCDRNSNVHTFSNTGGNWNTPISLGTGTNAKGVFYFVDGALRVCDANHEESTESTSHNSTNTPQWYGYVDRYFYGTSAAGYAARAEYYINRFVSTDVGLAALDVIATAKHASTPTATTTSRPINLKFTEASQAGSTWAIGATTTYDIAVTTLYDDSKQESALDIPDTNPTVDVQDANKLKVLICLFADNDTGIHQKHSRVSGFHIYMRENGKTDWFLQWEVDIEKGIRAYKTGDYTAFVSGSVGTTQANCESAYLLDPRQIETYEIMTSRDQSYDNVSLDTAGNCWRSALIANRRAWIAAPTMQDELGNTVTKGDTMIKSNVNQFDSFTLDNRVDVAIRDGEDIVAIAEFGDRILQFKQQTLYIINISQDFEFLEGTYKNRGILNHNAQCRTDYGVAWVNESGCYIYNGKQVINLLEKNGIDIIDISTWSDFINKDSTIGFAPKNKQLIILNSPIISFNSTGSNDIFVYDLVLGAWTRGYNKWTNKNKTNFITDWEDGLIVGHNPVGVIKSWGLTSDEKVFELVTRDIDFGKPAIRKKLYKVYITYKCSSVDTNVRVQYYVNGSSTAYNFKALDNATLDGDYATLDGSKSEWTTAVLRPSSSSEANNIYSVRIRLYNASAGLAVPSEFEVNDISLIHRRKPIK